MKLWPWKAAEPPQTIVKTVDVPVIGEAMLVTLYSVSVPIREYANLCAVMPREEKRYLTCEQAHTEHPGRAVVQVKAIKVGDVYFRALMPAIEVQPKPQVSKGRAKPAETGREHGA